MPDRIVPTTAPSSRRLAGKPRVMWDDPVREYVGDFAGQLALMAREAGDEALARALEAAVELATRPVAHPIALAAPLKRRAWPG